MNQIMDLEMLQAIITVLGGDDHIAAIIFDNSSRKVFRQGEFNLVTHLSVPNQEVLEFKEKDMLGNEIRVFKPIACIQVVIGIDDPANLNNLDSRFIAS